MSKATAKALRRDAREAREFAALQVPKILTAAQLAARNRQRAHRRAARIGRGGK